MPVHRPAWGDAAIERFQWRVALFQRRGEAPEAAEALADRLDLRDRERDDRGCCLECARMQHSRDPGRTDGCLAAREGWLGPGVDRRLIPLRRVLQRCPGLDYIKP